VAAPARDSVFRGSNGLIVYSSFRGSSFDLALVDPKSGDSRYLTTLPLDELQPAWSPDGSKVAFVYGVWGDASSQEIYVLDLDTRRLRRLTRNRYLDAAPTWSPDGTAIAFESDPRHPGVKIDVAPDIWIMDAGGRNRRPLTKTPRMYEREPAWSPGGSTIVFSRSRGVGSRTGIDLVYQRPGSRHATVLTGTIGDEYGANWRADRAAIAFWGGPGNRSGIYVVRRARAQRLRGTDERDRAPSWSPVGGELVFSSRRDYDANRNETDTELYLRSTSAGVDTRLTANTGDDEDPDWQPLCRRGSPLADRIEGTSAEDLICGLGAADRIGGRDGADTLFGGPGADRIDGGGGADVLVGESGADVILARDGRPDRIACGSGRDVAIVDRRDRIVGGCELVRRPG
jgi:TolB protein